jgi:hypothetical protein
MTDDLYRGVNTSSPPSHPKLCVDWVRPEPPTGFSNLVAILVQVKKEGRTTQEWMLDYLDTERNIFASEETELFVPWPWVKGFTPQASDWDSIGIPHMM